MLNCIHLYIYMHLSTIEIASKNLFEVKCGSLSWDILVVTFEYIPPPLLTVLIVFRVLTWFPFLKVWGEMCEIF